MATGLATPGDTFALQIAPQTCLTRAALAAARPFLIRLAGLNQLRRLYEAAGDAPGGSFEARVLHALGVTLQVEAGGEGLVPPAGALIVAANHPTGALDGLVLAETVRQVRSDVRILTNHLLDRIPELHGSCFFVDPFGGAAAAARSRAGLRAAHLWLRQGGALVMFPAGEVAWRQADGAGALPHYQDSPWAPTLGRLASATGAMVLPAFIDARNSALFYRAGRLHPMLRTALLGRQLLNKRGTAVRIVVGSPIHAAECPETQPQALTARIRHEVDALAPGRDVERAPIAAAIAPPVAPALLDQDIRSLPAPALLLSSGPLDVYSAGAESLPYVLEEIGRLREVTFRAVGEGTGRAADLDRFDAHYDHLFVWNRETREVVGAYRIGATDRVVKAHGVAGLYTRSLFRYDERMLARMGPALELGRSFVRQEYQRSYSALLLLWKGIGQLLARAPRYRALFGCVSISSRYHEISQQMLRVFLAQEHRNHDLADLVEPTHPPAPIRPPAREAVAAADVETLDSLISRIEGTQGMPVLLRQYLKLNATLLGFNVDPAFGDALDALMMVDLARLPRTTLQRYLGKTAAASIADCRDAAA